MWLAELAAPYAILPFVAGAGTCRRGAAAVVAGLAIELAAFFGLHAELMVDTHSPWTSLPGSSAGLPALHFYPSVYPRTLWNVGLWLSEAVVGLALAWVVVRYAASSGAVDRSGGVRVRSDRRTTRGGEPART